MSNVLSKVVYNLMKDGGYDGHYTNHSLRVSSATRLFDAQVDELIMSRTGHSSTDGVRAYKRTSNKLKELTSDFLNCKTVSTVEEQEPKSKRVCLKQQDSQENFMPTISITGGTNITINIKQ